MNTIEIEGERTFYWKIEAGKEFQGTLRDEASVEDAR